jgi:hypothetical protein
MKVRRWLGKLADAVPRGRRWRVLGRRLAGVVVLGAGLVLLILPGPGIPFVVAGLVLLEWDATWLRELACRWIERLAAVATQAAQRSATPRSAAALLGQPSRERVE